MSTYFPRRRKLRFDPRRLFGLIVHWHQWQVWRSGFCWVDSSQCNTRWWQVSKICFFSIGLFQPPPKDWAVFDWKLQSQTDGGIFWAPITKSPSKLDTSDKILGTNSMSFFEILTHIQTYPNDVQTKGVPKTSCQEVFGMSRPKLWAITFLKISWPSRKVLKVSVWIHWIPRRHTYRVSHVPRRLPFMLPWKQERILNSSSIERPENDWWSPNMLECCLWFTWKFWEIFHKG